ncbi:MAG: hypothetical protein SGILL_001677, partial [Bacillariaceae sp.]
MTTAERSLNDDTTADDIPHHQQTQQQRRPVAIITGGSRGIGSGIATVLASKGYDLLLTYNTDNQAAEAFKFSLQQRYPSCCVECVGGDLTITETRDAVFACLDAYFGDGHLQVLVHNAGQYLGLTSENSDGISSDAVIFGDGSLLKKDKDSQLHTDLSSIHYYQRLYGDAWIDLCERSIQRMAMGGCDNDHAVPGGTIIGISSPSVNPSLYKPDRTYSGPGSGKTIMEYSMRIYAKVVAEHNINVNVIVPGIVPTEAWERASQYRQSDESMEDVMERLVDRLVPLKRPVQPTDIGEVIAFLCSP